MSDMETPVDDVSTDVETEIDTTDVSTDTPDEISYEQALEWKKKAERLEKAEKSLVEYKKKAKELESKTSVSGEFITKADLAMDKFLDKNPDLADYREELASYQSKGIPLEKAKLLVEADDKTISNREKASKASITGGESGGGNKTFTDSQLLELSKTDMSAYNRAMEDIESGKAKHKA